MTSNLERMLALVQQVFDSKNDPDQLDVNEKVMERLSLIHPSSISEYDDGNGPVVWVLLIPTTEEIMKRFLNHEINEQDILDLTPINVNYQAIYLCSVLVLPEHRRKGLAKNLCQEAIENIRKNNTVKSLFVWPFTKEGEALAERISSEIKLKLYRKTKNPLRINSRFDDL